MTNLTKNIMLSNFELIRRVVRYRERYYFLLKANNNVPQDLCVSALIIFLVIVCSNIISHVIQCEFILRSIGHFKDFWCIIPGFYDSIWNDYFQFLNWYVMILWRTRYSLYLEIILRELQSFPFIIL